jgi:hypothetical protein
MLEVKWASAELILLFPSRKYSGDAKSPVVQVVKSSLVDHPAEIASFDPGCNPKHGHPAARETSAEREVNDVKNSVMGEKD